VRAFMEKPDIWVSALIGFGATGYPEDMARKMKAVRDKRHNIVHSNERHTAVAHLGTSQQSFMAAAETIWTFVETTAGFVTNFTRTKPPALSSA